MIIVGTDGEYELEAGTKTLKASTHPVYQAQIELNLRQQSWIGAPNAGHQIPVRSMQSPAQVELFRKELRFYLKKYSPEVVDVALNRSNVVEAVVISEDANG